MKKEYEVFSELEVVKKNDGTFTILVEKEPMDDLLEMIMFLAISVEVAANMFEMSVDELLEDIKENIEFKPMKFDSET